MGGVVLYLLTLALESISVLVRFALVAGLTSLVFGREVGIAAGIIAGLYPPLYSLAALAGLPRGHLLTRLQVGGRPLTPWEQARLDAALARPRACGVPIPRHIFAVDREGLNAFVSGRTLYVYRELFAHKGLAGVLAHELGHHNSLDGRISGAIFGLTLPGGFLLTYGLLSVLQWVAYGAFMLLLGLFVIVFLLMGLNVWGFLRRIFGVSVGLTRMAIIFAVGGVGTALLGSLWRSYFVQREFAADAYAARLGYADSLIRFFEHEVLSDVSIPWYTQPSHPPATRRIAALEQLAQQYPPARASRIPPPPPAPRRPRPAARPAPTPPWLLPATVAAGLLAALLLTAALLLGDRQTATRAVAPPAGPTPTLGVWREP